MSKTHMVQVITDAFTLLSERTHQLSLTVRYEAHTENDMVLFRLNVGNHIIGFEILGGMHSKDALNHTNFNNYLEAIATAALIHVLSVWHNTHIRALHDN